jgi:surface carbohydrate biosynthesis protein
MGTVALPIETKVRELHGKLWLGLHLLERGHNVVLGPSWEVDITLNKTQPTEYISQGPSDPKIGDFDKFREAGIRVYGMDPESGVGSSVEQFASNKKQVINHLDGFLCWGKKHKEELSKYYKNTDDIHITGNPRFDLQNSRFRTIYDGEMKLLQKEYGPFILVNTNFGIANAFNKDLTLNKIGELFGEIEIEELRHKKRTFYLFLESILYLSSKLDEHEIIVRPHPGEDHSIYLQSFEEYENIHVIHSGDVREWIAAAEMVMHHDCTTGIESVFMQTPVLSYRPVDNQSSEKKVPQAVSHEVCDRSNLVEKIQEIISYKPEEMSKRQKDILRPYFKNIDSSAATAICDIIEQQEPTAEKNYQKLKPTTWESIETHARTTRWFEQAAKAYDIVREFSGETSLKETRKKRNQKFPELAAEEILETMWSMSGDSVPVSSIKKVSGTNDTYVIHSK